VAIFAKDDVIEIFDSFGDPPPPRLQSWASRNARRWIYEPGLEIQHDMSVNCGFYALAFVIARPWFRTYHDTIEYIDRMQLDE
jgi:hypothetical protein